MINYAKLNLIIINYSKLFKIDRKAILAKQAKPIQAEGT